MPYPSTISVLATPQPTDRLNNPSHSTLHQNENSGVTEIQTFVGTLASTAGTLIYDIRAAASNGGGHVQTANKGGTGQTSYTKGDLLVAQSSSVLTKLAVSSTAGELLTADPNTATGVKWGPAIGNTKIAVNYSPVQTAAGQASAFTTFFAASIAGSTLGTGNAIRYTAYMPILNKANGTSFVAIVTYGGNTVGDYVINATPSLLSSGVIEGHIIASSSVNSQIGMGRLITAQRGTLAQNNLAYSFSTTNFASVQSSANQDLLIRISNSGSDSNSSFLGGVFVVEKIS